MPPLVISRDSITIGGKIIETTQSIGLSKQVAVNPLANTFIEEPVFNDTSLIAHYKFDGNLNDSSGNGNDIVDITGTIDYHSDIKTTGQSSLIQTNEYIQISALSALTALWSGAFSISFWVYPVQTITSYMIGGWDHSVVSGASRGGWHLTVDASNKLGWNALTNDSFQTVITSDVDLYINNWYHIVISTSGTTYNMVINDVSKTVTTTALSTPHTSMTNRILSIGNANRWGDSTFDYDDFGGYFDDFRIYNRVLTQNEITSLYFSKNTLVPITINDDYKYMSFVNTGANQSQYSITFNESTECDILIVGGGGGGGRRHGAGGGAGTLLYHKGQILNGTYNISVGNGGNGTTNAASSLATIGNFSEFKKSDNTKRYYANGGGVGTSSDSQSATTNGGQGYLFNSALTLPTNNVFNDVTVSVVSKQYQNTLSSPEGCRGFVGGGQVENFKGGGGGGAGSLGQSHGLESTINDGYGGDGLGVDITGINVLYAGGGNGGDFNGTVSPIRDPNKLTIESRGGGGFGSDNNVAEAGMNGTGGGGGGQGNDLHNGGNGGSGIVIIRYKTTKIIVPININEDYKYFSLTYNDIPEVVYDFTPYNTLQSWISYANSFGATTNVNNFSLGGVFIASTPIGEITYPLPNNYNYIDVIFSNLYSGGNVNLYIDNVLKMTATAGQTITYSDTYTTGQILKIDETNTAVIGKNLIIKLSRRQSQYSITFQEETECEILVVAGGGGGSAGGGGAGQFQYISSTIFNANTYNILVGKGGNGSTGGTNGLQGNHSKITQTNGTDIYISYGGGGGGGNAQINPIHTSGQVGSLGGSGHDRTSIQGSTSFGNVGGSALASASGSGGGGGGANQIGGNAYVVSGLSTQSSQTTYYRGGQGGNGSPISIKGFQEYYSGGGTAGVNTNNGTDTNPMIVVLGGGGAGSVAPNQLGSAGTSNTGGGGGGGDWERSSGASGGSGIVIIRYKKIAAPFDAQWTYNSINSGVYHLGNVGIGTINPTSTLDVLGSVVVNGGIISTSLDANTKNFKIAHPLGLNKWLYHGCVEGPRFDNMYRGKKMVINGSCEVDIDNECNTTGGMTSGTFMALNNNCQVFLENKQTYDMVKGEVIDGKIIISCENIAEEIEVEWLVIGERHDEGIIRNKLTNGEGMLICEHEVN